MFSIGVKNPDINIPKTMKNHAKKRACCCVLEIVEMKSPTPSVVRRNSDAVPASSQRLPRKGIPNQSVPMRSATANSMKAIPPY